jgi:hypothetical protein
MSDDAPQLSIPVPGLPTMAELDPEYVQATLHAIKVELGKQREAEAERMGATKLRNRMLAAFGSLITAGALAGFGWVAEVQSSTLEHASKLERIEERAHDHDPPPNGHQDLEAAITSNRERLQSAEHNVAGINARLDRMEREAENRHTEIRDELRRIRGGRQTWGDR